MDLELTDLRWDSQTNVRNAKSLKEANLIECAKEQGFVDSYRGPKFYLGETAVDFVSVEGSKKYELKTEEKSYQDSVKDIVRNIKNQAKDMKVGEALPDLESVPDFLKLNIAQNIQDQLQSK